MQVVPEQRLIPVTVLRTTEQALVPAQIQAEVTIVVHHHQEDKR